MTAKLPPTASVAHSEGGAKLNAPSAERNAAPLVELLNRHAPRRGRALEIASGTGQHVVAFARAFPGIDWQPSDPDPARRRSIDAWRTETGLTNIAKPIDLDAAAQGWGENLGPCDLIVLANLLHLIAAPAARNVILQAGRALAPRGTLILYGPFRRGGQLTSAGDVRFHSELQAADPSIGYKDDLDIRAWLSDAGLTHTATDEMPANNLAFVATKP